MTIEGLYHLAKTMLLFWIAINLYHIGTQEERQAVAAEQANKLLQEPGTMSQELGELVKVLKELQAAESGASAPKR